MRTADNVLEWFNTHSPSEWENMTFTEGELNDAGRLASNMSAFYAEVSEYLDYRGGMGCGDSGHEKAMKKARQQLTRVRKTQGGEQ